MRHNPHVWENLEEFDDIFESASHNLVRVGKPLIKKINNIDKL